MKICLISPRVAIQKNDFLGSGIPYWPIELAILASTIRKNDDVQVIDMFGSRPKEIERHQEFYLQGISITEMLHQISEPPELFMIFAISYMSHDEILRCISAIREKYEYSKIGVMENSQAVTAYAIDNHRFEFFSAGADFLLCGEFNSEWDSVREQIKTLEFVSPFILTQKSEGSPTRIVKTGFKYPFPAWDLFPVKNYWKLPYAHGPKTKKFYPILTSRGCPFPCDFCVVPTLNNRRWRGRPASEVVDEMVYLQDTFQVRDFQIEDLNPTVNPNRWNEIAEEIISRKLDVNYAFVSGTKAETMHVKDMGKYRDSGLSYFSISPESGSEKLMSKIGKKFDYGHGLKLISAAHEMGIYTQACLLVGHPDETIEDFKMTRDYLKKLLANGLDEVAVFVVAPFSGSKLYSEMRILENKTNHIKSFSPKNRVNYKEISHRRQLLILDFFKYKLRHPNTFLPQIFRSFIGKPQTKMENLPLRMIYIYFLVFRSYMKGKEHGE